MTTELDRGIYDAKAFLGGGWVKIRSPDHAEKLYIVCRPSFSFSGLNQIRDQKKKIPDPFRSEKLFKSSISE